MKEGDGRRKYRSRKECLVFFVPDGVFIDIFFSNPETCVYVLLAKMQSHSTPPGPTSDDAHLHVALSPNFLSFPAINLLILLICLKIIKQKMAMLRVMTARSPMK